MGSICLSTASILRCDSLTRNQNIYLIIPTALEVIFSTSLVFIDQGPGKRNLLLTAEGLSFLTLVLLELVSWILPAVRGNIRLFNAFDLAIGIASLLPIALYTIFLYLLTNAEIVSVLPSPIKNLTTFASIFFILVIIAFNEIAAFAGVSIRDITIPTDKLPQTIFAVGPSSQPHLWTLFTTFTLSLLTCFQIIVFCFAVFRFSQAISSRRRFESNHSSKTQLVKGIGWISGSLMLGVIETVIGFIVGGFWVVLSRRILRLLTRTSLSIGVIKGVDDFHVRSQFHEIISKPRTSTFRPLSPKATSFHAAQYASDIQEEPDTYRPLGLPGMAHFANVRAESNRQRVAVRYHKGTPLLHLRFSTLDMPSPATIAEEIKSRPQSEWVTPKPSFHQPSNSVFRHSSDSISSFGPFELVTTPRRTLSQRSARAKLYQAALPTTSGESLNHPNPDSTTSVEATWDVSRVQSVKSLPDSLQAVRDLAGQFPGPPLAYKDEISMPPVAEDLFTPQTLGFPSVVPFPFEGPSSHEGFALSDDIELNSNPVALSDNKSVRSTRQPTLYNVSRTASFNRAIEKKHLDPFDDIEEDSFRTTIVKTMPTPVSKPPDAEVGTGNLATARNSSRPSSRRRLRSMRPIPKKDIPLSKIRSIGKDSKNTESSLPRHSSPRRGNVQLKDIIIPPRRLNMPEIMDEYTELNSIGGRF